MFALICEPECRLDWRLCSSGSSKTTEKVNMARSDEGKGLIALAMKYLRSSTHKPFQCRSSLFARLPTTKNPFTLGDLQFRWRKKVKSTYFQPCNRFRPTISWFCIRAHLCYFIRSWGTFGGQNPNQRSRQITARKRRTWKNLYCLCRSSKST